MCIDVLFGDVSHLMCDVLMYVSTDNNIGVEGVKVLSQCLSHLSQLTHLDLSGECVHIGVLLDVWCALCHIDVPDVLMYVSTDDDIGYEGVNALSQCLAHLTQLTHLDLSGECVH